MPWDLDKAVKHLNSHAQGRSLGLCATYVRRAVEAGGVTLTRTLSAKNYGPSLVAVGFGKLPADPIIYRVGDVAVIQSLPGSPHGHIAMFNGKNWVSDFVQIHGYYPGSNYRKSKPAVAFYRYP